jgi:hypothetical protein
MNTPVRNRRRVTPDGLRSVVYLWRSDPGGAMLAVPSRHAPTCGLNRGWGLFLWDGGGRSGTRAPNMT